MRKNEIKDITGALYRVTEYLDDREPVKWRLRELAIRFDELVAHEENLSLKERGEYTIALHTIIGMLELVASLSHVARMNFESLLGAYIAYRDAEDSLKIQQIATDGRALETETTHQDHKEQELIVGARHKQIIAYLQNMKGASISIGEIVNFLGNIASEKTLQRDLNELITRGIVKAEGDRRWRRYSLRGQ